MRDGVVSALRSGRVTASSEGNEKFVKKPGPGQAGLAWRGRINSFIFKIVIEGKLSADWVAEAIPGGLTQQSSTEAD